MKFTYKQTEAPLIIKPFLPKMTKSEIHAVMTGGFATIAGLFTYFKRILSDRLLMLF